MYEHFTSLSPEEEKTFLVYEQRTQETAKKALIAGLITGAVVLLFTVVVVFSHDKPKNLMEGDDMGMLAGEEERADERERLEDVSEEEAAPAPEESAPAEEAPAEEAPAEEPDDDLTE